MTLTSATSAFVEAFSDSHTAHDIAQRLTCVEVDALADLLTELGHEQAAKQWIDFHAEGDDEGDSHYIVPA